MNPGSARGGEGQGLPRHDLDRAAHHSRWPTGTDHARDLAANHAVLTAAVAAQAPELLQVRGVGPVVAATVLHAWSHPGRVHSEPAFAVLAGVAHCRLRRATPSGVASTAAGTDASTHRDPEAACRTGEGR